MKKMLITLLLAISTGSHATVLKNATDTFPLVSLQQKKVNDNITQDGKLPKASVIFWIDLDKSKSNSGKTIRNVKAKVSINKEGNVAPTTTISENMFNRTNGTSTDKATTFNLVNPINNKIENRISKNVAP